MGKNVGTIVAPNVFFITAWQSIVFSLLIYFKKTRSLFGDYIVKSFRMAVNKESCF